MKRKPDDEIAERLCWCCGNKFYRTLERFKEHLDLCELKVIENPEEYDKDTVW